MTQNSINNTDKLIQYIHNELGTLLNCTGTFVLNGTIPTNTNGTEVLTATITPTSSSSTLLITFTTGANISSTGITINAALFQDSTVNALTATQVVVTNGQGRCLCLRYAMTSGTTSSTTFKIRVGVQTSGSDYIAGDTSGVQLFGGVYNTQLTIEEYV